MKKIILMMMALCAVAFVGCSKDGDGGSLVIDGVNLVGMWTDDQNREGFCDYLYVFKDSSLQGYYIPDENKPSPYGFTFKDGYLYGCTMADFEPEKNELYTAEILNGKLVLGGIMHNIKVIDKDTIIFYDYDGEGERWTRVKGFK